jgi:hypothetical protein
MTPLRSTVLAASALMGLSWAPGVALAQSAVALQANPAAQERPIVDALYGPFMRAHPGMAVQTGLVDLQGKGVASVMARFVSKDTCASDDECETVLLAYGGGRWNTVFEHAAKTVAVVPASGTDALLVDGSSRWTWNSYGYYMPDLPAGGQPFPAPTSAPAALAQAAGAAVSADPAMAPFVRMQVTSARQTALALAGAQSTVLVSLYGPGDCVSDLGCPNALMVRQGDGWKPVWTGFASGSGLVLSEGHNGFHDFVLDGASGYRVMAFDGLHYHETLSSYHSSAPSL